MKYVFIGGGNNGHTRSDGTKTPYETKIIDQYIVNLCENSCPHLLFIGHANKEYERTYFKQIKNNFDNCECQILKLQFLKNKDKTKDMLNWADIIYIAGGNSKILLDNWYQYGFDKLLEEIKPSNKILVGLSAGANVFFKYFNSDCEYNSTGEYTILEGLNYFNYLFTPHSDLEGRIESNKEFLKKHDIKALCLSKSSAIIINKDIIDIIMENKEAFVKEQYYLNNKYYFNDLHI